MASEINELIALLNKKGVSTDTIRQELTSSVREAYDLWTHQHDDSVTVDIDKHSEAIHISKDGKDITPPDFTPAAQQAARKKLIALIAQADTQNHVIRASRGFGGLIHVVFWFYNGLYILFTILFATYILPSITITDWIELITTQPIMRTVIPLLVMCLPYITLAVVIRKKVYTSTTGLAKLFFLFEIPLLALSFISFNVLSEAILPVWVLFTILLLIPFYWLFETLHLAKINAVTLILSHGIKIIILGTTAYIGLILAFFLPLIVTGFIKMLWTIVTEIGNGSGYFYFNFFSVIMGLIFGSLIVLSIALLIALPYFLTYTMWKSAQKSWKEIAQRFNVGTAQLITTSPALLLFVALFFSAIQPDTLPLINKTELVKNLPTFEQRSQLAGELRPHKETLRKGILDSANANNRYLFIKGDNMLQDMYESVFETNLNSFWLIQEAFDVVVYPFVYRGPQLGYNSVVQNNYQYLFGKTIYAQDNTNTSGTVKRTERKITAKSIRNGLFADVTIEESFTNSSFSDEEVIYEFSLPPDAVITGLKLGPQLEYPGIIAPRGAAASTYQREVNRFRDPALLEQTGPQQYRLRIFPIPGKVNSGSTTAEKQKVQFTYLVSLNQDGFALPAYTKEQNINSTAKGTITGQLDNTSVKLDAKSMVIPVKNARATLCNNTPGDIQIKSSTYEGLLHYTKAGCNSPTAVKDQRIAILYDTSALREETTQWRELLSFIRDNPSFITNNTVDLYFFNDLVSTKIPLNATNLPKEPTYFGQREKTLPVPRVPENYSALVILTDKEFTIPTNSSDPSGTGTRMHIAYAEGKVPPFNQALTRLIVQSETGIYTSVQDALLNTGAVPSDNEDVILTKTPYWTLSRTSDLNAPVADKQFSALLINKEIEKIISEYDGALEQNIAYADTLYLEAKNVQVVTLLSSLIALVNERQEQDLYYDSQKYDRYTDPNSPSGSQIQLPLPTRSTNGFNSLDTVGSSAYGFSDIGSAIGGIVNLFLLANAALVGLAALIYGVRKIRARNYPQ